MPAQVSYHRRCICCYHLVFWTRTACSAVWDTNAKSSQLKEEIEKIPGGLRREYQRLNELNSNPDAIEQVAREKYLMKKPNEDIYVFEDNK